MFTGREMSPWIFTVTACVLFSVPSEIFSTRAASASNHVAINAIQPILTHLFLRNTNTRRVVRNLVTRWNRPPQNNILSRHIYSIGCLGADFLMRTERGSFGSKSGCDDSNAHRISRCVGRHQPIFTNSFHSAPVNFRIL